jgi:hypothetical protein
MYTCKFMQQAPTSQPLEALSTSMRMADVKLCRCDLQGDQVAQIVLFSIDHDAWAHVAAYLLLLQVLHSGPSSSAAFYGMLIAPTTSPAPVVERNTHEPSSALAACGTALQLTLCRHTAGYSAVPGQHQRVGAQHLHAAAAQGHRLS